MTPKLTPRVGLVPTPKLEIGLHMVGDFLRAFEIPEAETRRIQQGFNSGDISAVTVEGLDYNSVVCASTRFGVEDLHGAGQFNIDPNSTLSVTAQMSRRFEQAIIYCVQDMRRRGLRITYVYTLGAAGWRDFEGTLAKYNLSPTGNSRQVHPGLRQVLDVNHPGVGARLTHSSI